MLTATCPRCRRRLAWPGDVIQRPACPRCGHRPDQRELARVAAQVARIRQGLIADGTLPTEKR